MAIVINPNELGVDIFYEDKGCYWARKQGYIGKCIACPFPECLEEIHQRGGLKKRNERIQELHKQGKTQVAIAKMYNLSIETIYAIIHNKSWSKKGNN